MPFKAGEQAPGSVPFKEGEDERRHLTGPTGSKHRSTIARKWLELELLEGNPLTGETEKLSQEDFITLQQLKEAKGKVKGAFTGAAYKNLMDSAYGAPKQEIINSGELTINQFDLTKYTDEELEQLAELQRKAGAVPPELL